MIAEKINRQREIEVSKTITQNNKVKNNDVKIIRPVVKKNLALKILVECF
jgi:hypothetical protein